MFYHLWHAWKHWKHWKHWKLMFDVKFFIYIYIYNWTVNNGIDYEYSNNNYLGGISERKRLFIKKKEKKEKKKKKVIENRFWATCPSYSFVDIYLFVFFWAWQVEPPLIILYHCLNIQKITNKKSTLIAFRQGRKFQP